MELYLYSHYSEVKQCPVYNSTLLFIVQCSYVALFVAAAGIIDFILVWLYRSRTVTAHRNT